jgi:hypothetical protein
MAPAYLIRVHFELADDLDGDLVSGLGVPSFVDVAESAVAHLFYQYESFESRVPRHLAGLLSLLGDNGLDVGLVDLLVLACGMGSRTACLSHNIAIVGGRDGILSGLRLDVLLQVSLVVA